MNHSPWINHVKQFSKEHNMTYKESLQHPECRESYHNGGSIKSNFISKMIATKQFDINKIKNPSQHLKTKYKPIIPKKRKPTFDEFIRDFKQIVYKLSLEEISKILLIMDIKHGKLSTNRDIVYRLLSNNLRMNGMITFMKLAT